MGSARRWCLLASLLAGALWAGGCGTGAAGLGTPVVQPSPTASDATLTENDIGISLALAQQDKDGFPHAFRVTFENKSDHDGIVALPVPMPGRAEEAYNLSPSEGFAIPPILSLAFWAPDGRLLSLLYTDLNARRPAKSESVRLKRSERCVRDYPTTAFYMWGRAADQGPNPDYAFAGCFKPGEREVQVQALCSVQPLEDTSHESAHTDSGRVTMRCSYDEKVFPQPEAKPPEPPLHEAVRKGDVAAVERLLAAGADVNARDMYAATPLHLAAESGDVRITEILLAKGANVSAVDDGHNYPLHIAALFGQVGVAKLLIAKGARVDVRMPVTGTTPLQIAAREGHLDVVQLLLDAGANPNARDDRGGTALEMAAGTGHVQIAALLLDNGVDPKAADPDGWTALHVAAKGGYGDVAELLLDRGADLNVKSAAGQTPLAFAVMAGREKTAKVLLARGADPNTRDNEGRTPLAVARKYGGRGMASLLQKYGAKE